MWILTVSRTSQLERGETVQRSVDLVELVVLRTQHRPQRATKRSWISETVVRILHGQGVSLQPQSCGALRVQTTADSSVLEELWRGDTIWKDVDQ